MIWSLQKFSGPARLTGTVLAGMLVGLVSACSRSTPTQAVFPEEHTLPADTAAVQKRHRESIASLIERASPGVLVTEHADGSVTVRIRGTGSFYGSEEPLYVIDGVPLPLGSGGRLAGINPNDVESVKVLKDAHDTALYGVRGANGVIVITTKRP
jgi:TonB-dependent SusC/RagA subfamily outer membrane receptor